MVSDPPIWAGLTNTIPSTLRSVNASNSTCTHGVRSGSYAPGIDAPIFLVSRIFDRAHCATDTAGAGSHAAFSLSLQGVLRTLNSPRSSAANPLPLVATTQRDALFFSSLLTTLYFLSRFIGIHLLSLPDIPQSHPHVPPPFNTSASPLPLSPPGLPSRLGYTAELAFRNSSHLFLSVCRVSRNLHSAFLVLVCTKCISYRRFDLIPISFLTE